MGVTAIPALLFLPKDNREIPAGVRIRRKEERSPQYGLKSLRTSAQGRPATTGSRAMPAQVRARQSIEVHALVFLPRAAATAAFP